MYPQVDLLATCLFTTYLFLSFIFMLSQNYENRTKEKSAFGRQGSEGLETPLLEASPR